MFFNCVLSLYAPKNLKYSYAFLSPKLTIKGANHLENLNGIQYLQSLKELVIESTELTDWKLLNQLKQLDYLNIENCLKAKMVLDYIPKSVTGLILNANYTDLNGL